MYDDMKPKYVKYWKDIPLALALASCMDPRYKWTTLKLCVDLNYASEPVIIPTTTSQKKMIYYKEKMDALFGEYGNKENIFSASSSEVIEEIDEEDDMISAILSQSRDASTEIFKSDLQCYFEERNISVSKKQNFDILKWWEEHEGLYPVLSVMAHDLLAIPVSTVPSESVFSGSERVVSKYRNCLSPTMIEALLCLKDWFDAEDENQDEDSESIDELMAASQPEP